MLDSAKTFLSLNNEQKRFVHLGLCKNTLKVWTNCVADSGEISFVEWIVGTHQIADKLLPKDAFEAVKSGKDLSNVDDRYAEPIFAMQNEY